jgi:hypothetical protein
VFPVYLFMKVFRRGVRTRVSARNYRSFFISEISWKKSIFMVKWLAIILYVWRNRVQFPDQKTNNFIKIFWALPHPFEKNPGVISWNWPLPLSSTFSPIQTHSYIQRWITFEADEESLKKRYLSSDLFIWGSEVTHVSYENFYKLIIEQH